MTTHSPRYRANWRPLLRYLGFPLGLVLLGALASGNRFYVHLATSALIVYIVTMSFNLIFGYAGLFTLAHIALYGLGAYSSVIFQNELGVGFWAALPLAVLFAGVCGFLLAIPTMRLSHVFLAVATLGFATATEDVFHKWTSVTGGADGLRGIDPPALFGSPIVGGSMAYFWLAAVGAILAFEISIRVDASRMGRRFIVMRENPLALMAIGVNAARERTTAFVLSGLLAGFGGALFAHFQLFISSDSFGLSRVIELFIAVMVGGPGTVAGPIIGVVALVGIDEVGARLQDASELLYGIVFILILNYGQGNRAFTIAGLIQRLSPWHNRELATSRTLPQELERGKSEIRPLDQVEGAVPAIDLALTGHLVGTDQSELLAQDISVAFGGVKALNEVTLRCRAGEVVGLIGPNGAGKTTFVNVLTGFVGATQGTVSLDGKTLNGLRADQIAQAGLGRTFQHSHLIPELDVLTNVAIGWDRFTRANVWSSLLHGRTSRSDKAQAMAVAWQLLEQLQLDDVALEPASSLPYGVQRRVEVGRALAMAPRFLLLDEPGAGLSGEEREEVAKVIRITTAQGIGCLLIDHNVSFVATLSERLVVLDQGRLIAEGPATDVLRREDVSAAYLGGEHI